MKTPVSSKLEVHAGLGKIQCMQQSTVYACLECTDITEAWSSATVTLMVDECLRTKGKPTPRERSLYNTIAQRCFSSQNYFTFSWKGEIIYLLNLLQLVRKNIYKIG